MKKHIGIRIFFLALFLSYFADITFFTHSHIINGVTIVHSHYSWPFSQKKNSKPLQHSHTANALTLIAHAQAWQGLVEPSPEIPEISLVRNINHLVETIVSSDQISIFNSYLRGPPTYVMC